MTSKKKSAKPLPELPLASQAEIDPTVAAIKEAQKSPIRDAAMPPRRGPLICDDLSVDPEIRAAHRPYSRRLPEHRGLTIEEYDNQQDERVQRAREVRDRRLLGPAYEKWKADATANAIRTALEKLSGAEALAAVDSIRAQRTRERARKAIAESQKELRAKAGRNTGRARAQAAAKRDAAMMANAEQILRSNPGMPRKELAAALIERGEKRSYTTILKKLQGRNKI